MPPREEHLQGQRPGTAVERARAGCHDPRARIGQTGEQHRQEKFHAAQNNTRSINVTIKKHLKEHHHGK